MNKQLIPALALAVACGAAQAADAALVPLEWTAAGEFIRDLTVPATRFVEVCGKLPAGARVAWAFDASGPLNFNIHFHEGKKVVFPAKRDAVAQADGVLDVRAEQDYCWMWTNPAPRAATLKLELKRQP